MIPVDVNLPVAATMDEAPRHGATRSWLQEQLSGLARVGLPWATLTGFVRVASQPRAWERPLAVSDAVEITRSWSTRPCTWTPEPGPRHVDHLATLLAAQPSVRLVSDAHLAAIALEHGLQLCSQDRDFARWEDQGLRSRNPLVRT